MKPLWWALGLLGAALLGSDVLGRQMGLGALGAGSAGGVALTFDDGPSERTPELLALLKRHGAHATFFLTGTRAQADPDAVQAIRAAGHQLESHGFTHRHALTLLLWAEWRHLRWHPEPGRTGRLYRPPWGGHSPFTRLLARAAGVKVALWDVESRDWTDREPGQLAEEMLAQLRPGSVVLLHDGPAHTLEILDVLLPALKARGLAAVTMQAVQPQRIGWAAGLERLKRMW